MITARDRGQIGEQLSEVELRIDAVSTAGGSKAGQDGCGSSAAGVANEETVLAVMEILP